MSRSVILVSRRELHTHTHFEHNAVRKVTLPLKSWSTDRLTTSSAICGVWELCCILSWVDIAHSVVTQSK